MTNRIPFRLLSLACACSLLTACGDDPDDTAPSLDKAEPTLVSIFDTVLASFDEGIAEVEESQVEAHPGVRSEMVGGKAMAFYGADSVVGIPRFLEDTTYRITLTGVEDGSGNKADAIQFQFSTMDLIDRDFISGEPDNADRATASKLADSVMFFQGTQLDESLVACGILTANAKVRADFQDVYYMRLRARDSVNFEVSGFSGPVVLKFEGPANAEGDLVSAYAPTVTSTASGSKQVLALKVDANRHTVGSSSTDTYLDYWVTVKYAGSANLDAVAATPYVLTARIMQR